MNIPLKRLMRREATFYELLSNSFKFAFTTNLFIPFLFYYILINLFYFSTWSIKNTVALIIYYLIIFVATFFLYSLLMGAIFYYYLKKPKKNFNTWFKEFIKKKGKLAVSLSLLFLIIVIVLFALFIIIVLFLIYILLYYLKTSALQHAHPLSLVIIIFLLLLVLVLLLLGIIASYIFNIAYMRGLMLIIRGKKVKEAFRKSFSIGTKRKVAKIITVLIIISLLYALLSNIVIEIFLTTNILFSSYGFISYAIFILLISIIATYNFLTTTRVIYLAYK